MTRFAYVNGGFSPVEEAAVSIEDRGFLFGDGVYDVVRVANQSFFRLGRHLERLRDNAHAIEIANIPPAGELEDIARELLERSDIDEGMLYLQVTRGAGPRQSDYPDEGSPTVVAYVDEMRRGVGEIRDEGASVILVPEMRWKRCDIKSVNLLPKVMMKEKASQSDCYEAVFSSEQGEVWEGTSTNLFVVEDGALRTTDHPERVLPGITRREVVEIAATEGIPVELSTVRVEELYEADEVFLTGTLTRVLGIVDVDGETIGDGSVGPMTQRLDRLLRERIEAETR